MQEAAEADQRQVEMRLALQQSQEALEQKNERLQEVEARSRDLFDTTTRLEAHIQGLCKSHITCSQAAPVSAAHIAQKQLQC